MHLPLLNLTLPTKETEVFALWYYCGRSGLRSSRPTFSCLPIYHWSFALLQVSYILCPPGDDSIDPLVHRAGLPAKLPPAVNNDELAGPDPLPSSFDQPLRDPYFDDKLSKDLSILILCLRILHHNFMTMTLTMTHPMTLPRIRRGIARTMIGGKRKMTTLMTTMSFWSSLFLRFTPLCLPNVHSPSCTFRPQTRPNMRQSMRMSETALCPLLLQQTIYFTDPLYC